MSEATDWEDQKIKRSRLHVA